MARVTYSMHVGRSMPSVFKTKVPGSLGNKKAAAYGCLLHAKSTHIPSKNAAGHGIEETWFPRPLGRQRGLSSHSWRAAGSATLWSGRTPYVDFREHFKYAGPMLQGAASVFCSNIFCWHQMCGGWKPPRPTAEPWTGH